MTIVWRNPHSFYQPGLFLGNQACNGELNEIATSAFKCDNFGCDVPAGVAIGPTYVNIANSPNLRKHF